MAAGSYISAFLRVYREIKIQRKYNTSFLIPYLRTLEDKYQGRFSEEQEKKITNYYGLFITSFLCSTYKSLYGKKLTPAERKRATLFGILTPVGDDLFDIDKLDHTAIEQITFSPQTYHATGFSSKVAKEIQGFLLENVPHTAAYLKASGDVLSIQRETEAQTRPDITPEAIERITYTKGAVSVIIYHQCLDDAADEQMQEVLYLTGSLYQLGNDIFDLYKDVRDNIYTLVNTCHNFEALKTTFLNKVKLQNRKIMQLPYVQKDKEAFCIVMNTINARSLVALEQFIKFQRKKGTRVNWWQQERKDMIVDMEKPVNFLKWFYYIWKLPKLT